MRPLDGYPTSFGNQRASIAGVVGPTLYAPVVPGATPSGGQIIEAVAFGLKFFDFVIGGLSDSGTYYVQAAPVTPTVGAPQNSAGPTYRLQWIVVSSGLQAAAIDLDAETVRIMVFGPK